MQNDKDKTPKTHEPCRERAGFQPARWTNSEPKRETVKNKRRMAKPNERQKQMQTRKFIEIKNTLKNQYENIKIENKTPKTHEPCMGAISTCPYKVCVF
ncbi:MAG: hypothetical protein LBV16_09065 [Elusimicrobiota bacterium]|jgi:hypothetical protein|nr:hypothetical protein [Elusimicrobiota bacterium]